MGEGIERQGPGVERWRRAPELPSYVFEAWRKPAPEVNPIAVVSTVDSDGAPRTAPFGSLRAVSPKLLRLITLRHHDTYQNLCRDGRVMVQLLAPPDIAVSVSGRARVVKEQMEHAPGDAIVDIDVEEVKNDMTPALVIDTGCTISILDAYQAWFDAALGEVDGLNRF